MNCLWLGPSITLDAHRYILLYHYQDRFREIRRTETVSQPQTAKLFCTRAKTRLTSSTRTRTLRGGWTRLRTCTELRVTYGLDKQKVKTGEPWE